MDDTLNGLCGWLRETKGVKKIELMELMEYLPEYEEYLKTNR